MKPLLLAAALAAASGQAHALSCMRPDPILTFQQLAEAPETYFVLYGELSFDEGQLPPAVMQKQMSAPDPIPARFVGHGLSTDGFTLDFVANVELQIGCAGPWCGTAQSGVDAIYFVEATDPPLTIHAGPCGGRIFERPSQAVLDTLTACMQGGDCSAQTLQ